MTPRAPPPTASASRVALLCLALSSACCAAPRIALGPMPAASAPLAERAAAYERLRPAAARDDGSAVILQDGTLVADLHDLAPAVDAASATDAHIANADDAALVERAAMAVGAMFASCAVVAATKADRLVFGGAAPPFEDRMLAVAGCSILASASASAGVLAGSVAMREHMLATVTYDADLRRRLALVPDKRALAAQWEGE